MLTYGKLKLNQTFFLNLFTKFMSSFFLKLVSYQKVIGKLIFTFIRFYFKPFSNKKHMASNRSLTLTVLKYIFLEIYYMCNIKINNFVNHLLVSSGKFWNFWYFNLINLFKTGLTEHNHCYFLERLLNMLLNRNLI